MARKAKRAILPVTVSLEGVAKPESVFVHRIGKRFIGLALVLLGVPLELLTRAFGWAATTVRGWKQRFEESGGVDDAPRSGRSRAWNDEHIQLLKDELRSTKPRAAGRLKAVVAKLVSGGQLPPVKSKTTITSALKRAGMRYLAVVRLTFLTDEQRAARVAFSRAQLSHDRRARGLGPSLCKAGAFSDSSYFQSQAHAQRAAARRLAHLGAAARRPAAAAHGTRARPSSAHGTSFKRCGVPRREQVLQKSAKAYCWQDAVLGRRHEGMSKSAGWKVHCYGAITPFGATELITDVTGTTGVPGYSFPATPAGPRGAAPKPAGVFTGVCCEEYRDILGEQQRVQRGGAAGGRLLAQVAAIFAAAGVREWFWQQDGAPAHSLSDGPTHKGAGTKRLIEKYTKFFAADWPSSSPDLSIIENIWGMMERELEVNGEWSTQAEFTAAVVAAWDKVTGRSTGDLSTLKALFGGVRGRFSECVERDGWHVKCVRVDAGSAVGRAGRA